MKKLITLLLAIVVCISLCACGGDSDIAKNTDATEQDNIDILGEWVWIGDDSDTLTFKDDNICLYSNGDSVKYNVDNALAIVTLYDDTTMNYDIVEQNGVVKISGSKVYVRAVDYEIAHAEYAAQKEAEEQAPINQFYAEGKEGRTELEYGIIYNITDNLTMTVNECVSSETVNDNENNTLFLFITLTNTSNENIIIRGSDSQLQFTSQGHIYTPSDSPIKRQPNPTNECVKVGFDDNYVWGNSGGYLDIAPNAQQNYYIEIPHDSYLVSTNGDLEWQRGDYHYVIFEFDNLELFCNITELRKSTE